MADLLTTTRQEIEQRLQELRPLVAEAERLERALSALSAADEEVDADAVAPRPVPRAAQGAPTRPGRPVAPSDGAARRRGAPRGRRGGATRANEFLEIIREGSGTSIGEAAARMGTSPNYLYRLAATLQEEGLIEKRGRSFVATGAARGAGAQVESDPASAWESSSAVALPGEVHPEEVGPDVEPAGGPEPAAETSPYGSLDAPPGPTAAIDAVPPAPPGTGFDGDGLEDRQVDAGSDPAMSIPESVADVEPDLGPDAGGEVEQGLGPEAGADVEPDLGLDAGGDVEQGLEPYAGADRGQNLDAEIGADGGQDLRPDEAGAQRESADPGGGDEVDRPPTSPPRRPSFDF